MIDTALLIAGLAAYALTSLAGVRPALSRGAAAAGIVLHASMLTHWGVSRLYVPGTNLYEAFILLTTGLMGLTLLIDVARRMPILTRLMAPVALAFIVVATVAGPRGEAETGRLDPRAFSAGIHVLMTLASYALFMVAFVTGALYIAAQRALKGHEMSENLPPLETALRLNRAAVALGFALLTAGILIGYLEARSRMPGPEWRLDAKILLATATWAAYGVVLLMAVVPRLRGRREVVASMASIVLVMLTLVATLGWSGFHRFV